MIDNEFQLILPSHLRDRLPQASSVINFHNSPLCKKAISHLLKQDAIGLSFEGSTIDRYTELEWLCISSPECTFLFDIKKIGRIIFEQGLKIILENKSIIKIIHDCRKPSDVLLHKYDTKLCNVYDTQAAEFMVKSQKNSSEIDSKVNSLDYCLSTYLEVQEEFLYHQNNICYDDRPLSFDLRNFFIKNVMYLKLLRTEFNKILKTPFRRCTEICLQSIQKMSDDELALNPPNLKCIPLEVIQENVEVIEISEKLKELMHSVKDTSNNIADPELRYQVACMKYKNVGLASENDDESVFLEKQNNFADTNNYFHRKEIVKFLMDKMCDPQHNVTLQGETCESAAFSMENSNTFDGKHFAVSHCVESSNSVSSQTGSHQSREYKEVAIKNLNTPFEKSPKVSSSSDNKSNKKVFLNELKEFLRASRKFKSSESSTSSKTGDSSSSNNESPKNHSATQHLELLKAHKTASSSESIYSSKIGYSSSDGESYIKPTATPYQGLFKEQRKDCTPEFTNSFNKISNSSTLSNKKISHLPKELITSPRKLSLSDCSNSSKAGDCSSNGEIPNNPSETQLVGHLNVLKKGNSLESTSGSKTVDSSSKGKLCIKTSPTQLQQFLKESRKVCSAKYTNSSKEINDSLAVPNKIIFSGTPVSSSENESHKSNPLVKRNYPYFASKSPAEISMTDTKTQSPVSNNSDKNPLSVFQKNCDFKDSARKPKKIVFIPAGMQY